MKSITLEPLFAGMIDYPTVETVAKFPGTSRPRENRSNKKKIPLTLNRARELASKIPLFN